MHPNKFSLKLGLAAQVVLILAFQAAAFPKPICVGDIALRPQWPKTSLGWSRYAEIVQDEDGETFVRRIECNSQKSPVVAYDLSSPREWLEFMEVGGGEGAYTVLRCDYRLKKRKWRIWGKEFHVKKNF